MNTAKWIVVGLIAGISGYSFADRVIDISGSPNDRSISESGALPNGLNMRAGNYPEGNTNGQNSTLMFELPVLREGKTVSAATLTFYVSSVTGEPPFNADLYGIAFDKKVPAKYYEGPFAADQDGSTGLQDDIMTPATVAGPCSASSEGNKKITEWIRSFYTANPDYKGGSFAVFRMSPDTDSAANVGYGIAQGGTAGKEMRLSLTITDPTETN
jgi:hypothetical protein